MMRKKIVAFSVREITALVKHYCAQGQMKKALGFATTLSDDDPLIWNAKIRSINHPETGDM